MGDLQKLGSQLREVAESVRRELGCGFSEGILQNAFALELREQGIEYLKEVNIEIFYKKQSVGTGRPDFVITRFANHAESIIVELKVAKETTTNHDYRAQLKAYCASFPLNHAPVLTNFAGGILLTFPKADLDHVGQVKLFIVDKDGKTLLDEQQEAKERKSADKKKAKGA